MADSIHYLKKGWRKWYKFKKRANASALEHFTRAQVHAMAAKAWALFEIYDNKWVDDPEDEDQLTAARNAAYASAKEAFDLLESDLREENDDYRIHWVRGYAHLAVGEIDDAVLRYTDADTLSHKTGNFDFELQAERAHLLIVSGQVELAISNLETALDEEQRSFFLQYLGWAYLEIGSLAEDEEIAKKWYEKAIAKLSAFDTKNIEYLVFLGAAYANMDDQVNNDLAYDVLKTIHDLPGPFDLVKHEDWMKNTWHYKDPQRVTKMLAKLRAISYP